MSEIKLLNQNTKLIKARKDGIMQFGLELLPHTMGGYENICKGSSSHCRSTCLVLTNNARFKAVLKNRQLRTDLFFKNKILFFDKLISEINYYNSLYKNIQIRLNTFSDIDWSTIIVKDNKNIFELTPSIQYYDYSKIQSRCYLNIPNYFVVYSGQANNFHISEKLLKDNKPVALVFKKVPQTYKSWIVVNGDDSDNILQWKGQSVIIGLKYKNLTVLSKGVKNSDLLLNNKLVIQNEH